MAKQTVITPDKAVDVEQTKNQERDRLWRSINIATAKSKTGLQKIDDIFAIMRGDIKLETVLVTPASVLATALNAAEAGTQVFKVLVRACTKDGDHVHAWMSGDGWKLKITPFKDEGMGAGSFTVPEVSAAVPENGVWEFYVTAITDGVGTGEVYADDCVIGFDSELSTDGGTTAGNPVGPSTVDTLEVRIPVN